MPLRRRLASVLSLSALALVLAVQAVSAQSASMDPPAGLATDVFTFRAEGYEPGARVTDVFVSPQGVHLPLVKDGLPAVWVVGEAGVIEYQFIPVNELPGFADGGGPGTWLHRLCLEGTDACLEGAVEILPEPAQ